MEKNEELLKQFSEKLSMVLNLFYVLSLGQLVVRRALLVKV